MLRLSQSNRRQHFGKFPSVSINDNGTIVEVYQPFIPSYKILYKIGRLNGEELKMREETRCLDYGCYPKVAINNRNQVVEVHEGRVLRQIYYHIGIVDINNETVNWYPCVYILCGGKYPAVAVHGDRVVITYDRAFGSYTSYYYVGNFTTDGTGIQWEPGSANHKLMDATETSVAMNDRNIVVAGRRWSGIMCRLGRFRGNSIEFTKEFPFTQLGYYCPSVCLNNDGYILMVWRSTTRKLKYIATNIADPENPSITWPKNDSIRTNEYGCNPTIAITPGGGRVIEEHETIYPLYRCLYYCTGVLDKLPHEVQPKPQEQVLSEQVKSQEEPQLQPTQESKFKGSTIVQPRVGKQENQNVVTSLF